MSLIVRLDEWLALCANYAAGRSPLLDKIVFDLSDSTLFKGGLFLAFYWWLWFQPGERRDDTRRTVVAAVIGGTIASVISRLLQIGLPFHRRPLHTPHLDVHVPLSIDPETLNAWSSFPSDHAVLFFALCVPIWMRSRLLGFLAGLWTLLFICLPRVYLGYHYPSDILAGAVIGILMMLAFCAILARTTLPDRIVRLEARRPGIFYAVAFVLTLELALLFYDLRHFGLDAVRLGQMVIG